MVLDADPEKRRISLGLKQCMANPWDDFVTKFPVDSIVEGEIKNITEFGLFIGLDGEIDGMAHLSDLSWDLSGEEALAEFKKGDVVKAKVLDVDISKERISLGIKQLSGDPVAAGISSIKKGDIVTCTITGILDNGIEVKVNDDVPGFIRKAELSRDRSEQRPDRFAAGEKVDAKVTQLDKAARRLTLSIKAKEAEEEKEAMATYGSSDSGASLGDILGAALEKRAAAVEPEDEVVAEKKPAKKKAAPKKAAKAKAEEKVEAKADADSDADAKGDE